MATSCASTATLVSGLATCVITASKAGTYSAYDTYLGDANYNSISSATDSVTVNAEKTNHLSVTGGGES